jgi:hypothetical protein
MENEIGRACSMNGDEKRMQDIGGNLPLVLRGRVLFNEGAVVCPV